MHMYVFYNRIRNIFNKFWIDIELMHTEVSSCYVAGQVFLAINSKFVGLNGRGRRGDNLTTNCAIASHIIV